MEIDYTMLETMLNRIVKVKSEEGDYSTVADANYYIEMIKLGIPVDAEIQDIESRKLEQLKRAEKEYRKEALQMYIENGSRGSLCGAESMALEDGDYETALGLRIERGQVERAFDILEYMNSQKNLKEDDMQKYRERIIRDAYGPVVEIIKAEIGKAKIRSPGCDEPDGETIAQLMNPTIVLLYTSAGKTNKSIKNLEIYIEESIKCAMNSDDPKIIKIGLESNGCRPRSYKDNSSFEDTEMFLKGKLADDCDQCVQYFIKHAEEKQKEENYDMAESYAMKAIDILRYHKKGNDALEVAEKYLSPASSLRIKLLEGSGDLSDPNALKLFIDYYTNRDLIKCAIALAREGEHLEDFLITYITSNKEK